MTTMENPLSRTAIHSPASYRPVIDGLRAIAVGAVLLYHFGFTAMSGGFVGVDIFFVLSGFLICGQLQGELRETGRIRFTAFWLRRIRRLAPAFFAMAAVTALAGYLILLPYELRALGKELIAATTWLSNVLFWRDAGYFDAASDMKPLLHTWSLSVEEQFYLVIPLICLILAKLRGLAVGLLALWVASLVACLWFTPTHPDAAFFLFPFRAWEMLTGALVALWLRGDGARRWSPGLAGVGMALIFVSLFTATEAGFPGWQALLPVLGTALVLGARDQGPLAATLAHPWPVAVGLVSYSLYLWHWPVIVLSRYWRGGWSGVGEAVAWFAVAVGLALAAYWLVERPLRRATLRPLALVGGFVAGVAAICAVGLWFWRADGLAGRFGPLAGAHIAASQDFLQDWSRCTVPSSGPYAGVEVCPIGPDAPFETVKTVIWGDSHLRALMDGLAANATTPALIIWHAGCPPLLGVTKRESAATPDQDAACTLANTRMGAALAETQPDTLILVGRWRYYADGAGIGRDAQNKITLEGATYDQAWAQTVDTLAPLVGQITVLRQVPELPEYESATVARGLVHGRLTPEEAALMGTGDPAVLAASMVAAEAPIRALVDQGRVTLVDPWPVLCAPLCKAVTDAGGLWFDNNHLTNAGAMVVAPLLRDAMGVAQ